MCIFFDGVTDVERLLGFDVTGLRALPESNTVHYIVRFIVHQFQFDMFLISSYYLACTIIVYIEGSEYRFMVVRPERIELLQVEEEFRCNIPEVEMSINLNGSTGLFRKNILSDIFFESA